MKAIFRIIGFLVTVDDNGTEYTCSISRTLTPENPDEVTILDAYVVASDDQEQNMYVPSATSIFGIEYKNLTTTNANIGIDMENDGIVEFWMTCDRQ